MSTVDPTAPNVEAAEAIDLDRANAELDACDALGRVRWAWETFGEQALLLSSMQKTASVLMHLVSRTAPELEIAFVDTGFHFHETLRLRDDFLLRYRVNLRTIYPDHTPAQQEELYGKKLYLFVDGQPECCRLRKEVPFLNYALQTGKRLILNGSRRVDGAKRKDLRVLQADPRIDGYILHPLADWSDDAVQGYLAEHDVPVHPLHAQSYPSIGCQPCTTPVAPGEPARAGRWRHLRTEEGEQPLFCGINFGDGSGI